MTIGQSDKLPKIVPISFKLKQPKCLLVLKI